MQASSTEKLAISACDIIEEKCRKHPHIKYERKNDSLTVFSSGLTGFPVSYQFSNSEHLVSFLGWHETFGIAQEAVDCFGFGLSKKCRLQVWKKGSFQYKWIVETQNENGLWQARSITGLLFFPFWMKTETVILQNDLLG
jgi:hypothetical protein